MGFEGACLDQTSERAPADRQHLAGFIGGEHHLDYGWRLEFIEVANHAHRICGSTLAVWNVDCTGQTKPVAAQILFFLVKSRRVARLLARLQCDEWVR